VSSSRSTFCGRLVGGHSAIVVAVVGVAVVLLAVVIAIFSCCGPSTLLATTISELALVSTYVVLHIGRIIYLTDN
jgi:hypothetical protein